MNALEQLPRGFDCTNLLVDLMPPADGRVVVRAEGPRVIPRILGRVQPVIRLLLGQRHLRAGAGGYSTDAQQAQPAPAGFHCLIAGRWGNCGAGSAGRGALCARGGCPALRSGDGAGRQSLRTVYQGQALAIGAGQSSEAAGPRTRCRRHEKADLRGATLGARDGGALAQRAEQCCAAAADHGATIQ